MLPILSTSSLVAEAKIYALWMKQKLTLGTQEQRTQAILYKTMITTQKLEVLMSFFVFA